MAIILEIAIERRSDGDGIIAAQDDFPAAALEFKDIVSLIRRNSLDGKLPRPFRQHAPD